jgi:hypothetical protein
MKCVLDSVSSELCVVGTVINVWVPQNVEKFNGPTQ